MKHKAFESFLYSTIGILAMLLIVFAINFMLRPVTLRADLTQEKLHTLSDGTRAILKKIDGPIEVRFYHTKGDNTDPMMNTYAQRVEDLLNEYKRLARGKIEIKKLSPEPDSEAEDSARADGVEPEASHTGEPYYLGIAVSYLGERVAIPALSPQREKLLEYDLSRAISRVGQPEKAVIGVMSGIPVFGQPMNPMMMRMGQQGGSDPWVFISELQRDFNVKQIEMDVEKIDDDVRVLLVVHPKQISDKAQYAIDQFVMRGGRLIAFLDAYALVDSRSQQGMGQMAMGSSSNLERLLKAWGIQYDATKVVADMTFAHELRGQNGKPQLVPTFLFLNEDGINADEAVTSQMDNILLPFAGTFSGTPVSGLKETVLLKSTAKSQLVEGFLASLSGEQIVKDFKSSGTVYPLAVRLEGKFKTAFPEGKPESKEPEPEKKDDKKPEAKPEKKPDNSLKESPDKNVVILMGDADCLADQFSVQVENFFGSKIIRPFNANLTLVQNMVEQLAGDVNLIGARSRASLTRPFTRVKKMEDKAQESYRTKIRDMEQSLAETERKLSELQSKKEAGQQRFILSPEQQAEVEKFRKNQAETRKELKVVRKQLRQDIDSLETRLKWANIGGMPVLVVLAGIAAALWRNKLRK